MSASDTAIVIGATAPSVVAIVVSVIGYKAAKRTSEVGERTARETTETAKATADAERELERERLRAKKSRDHTTWYLEQRRAVYLDVLAAVTRLDDIDKQGYDPDAHRAMFDELGQLTPRMRLFGAADLDLQIDGLQMVILGLIEAHGKAQPDTPGTDLYHAREALVTMTRRLWDAMRSSMGVDPWAL
jgi:hypothetical protein